MQWLIVLMRRNWIKALRATKAGERQSCFRVVLVFRPCPLFSIAEEVSGFLAIHVDRGRYLSWIYAPSSSRSPSSFQKYDMLFPPSSNFLNSAVFHPERPVADGARRYTAIEAGGRCRRDQPSRCHRPRAAPAGAPRSAGVRSPSRHAFAEGNPALVPGEDPCGRRYQSRRVGETNGRLLWG